MSSRITLEGVRFVITGDFDFIAGEDARWDLISRGAASAESVSTRTQVLIAGSRPKAALLSKAQQLGTPIVGPDALRALLDGVALRDVLAGRRPGDAPAATAPRNDLGGQRIALSGRLASSSHGQVKSLLEARGAHVSQRLSDATTLIILGEDTAASVRAIAGGTPFLREDDLARLLDGAPLSDFVAPPVSVAEPEAHVRAILAEKTPEIIAFAQLGPGEDPIDDTLAVEIEPPGRVRIRFDFLTGTPIEERTRRLLQKVAWPLVAAPIGVTIRLRFE